MFSNANNEDPSATKSTWPTRMFADGKVALRAAYGIFSGGYLTSTCKSTGQSALGLYVLVDELQEEAISVQLSADSVLADR